MPSDRPSRLIQYLLAVSLFCLVPACSSKSSSTDISKPESESVPAVAAEASVRETETALEAVPAVDTTLKEEASHETADRHETEFAVEGEEPEPQFEPLPPLSKEWTRITKETSPQKVWVNATEEQVVVSGNVCLTRGYLEMFACVKNTKEHESVVAIDAKSQTMHFALLGVGAEHGKPALWTREGDYTPASGQTIEVFVEWMQGGKPKRVKAQQWIRDLKTRKPMAHEWVFAGSSTWTDPETGKSIYRADGGEVICVSNFPVAMMDLPIESSQANEELAFEAMTESIPTRRTPVRLYLVPMQQKKSNSDSDDTKVE